MEHISFVRFLSTQSICKYLNKAFNHTRLLLKWEGKARLEFTVIPQRNGVGKWCFRYAHLLTVNKLRATLIYFDFTRFQKSPFFLRAPPNNGCSWTCTFGSIQNGISFRHQNSYPFLSANQYLVRKPRVEYIRKRLWYITTDKATRKKATVLSRRPTSVTIRKKKQAKQSNRYYCYTKRLTLILREVRNPFSSAPLEKAGVHAQLGVAYVTRMCPRP